MIYPLLGAAFAVAGVDKLSGDRGYEDMFRQLGWSQEEMRAAAMAEVAGGAMLACGWTRRLGAAVLAVTSGAVLASEMRRGEGKLAGPRGVLLGLSLLALVAPRR